MSIFVLAAAASAAGDGARAGGSHHSKCKEIDRPTTIDVDRKCVRATTTVNGDVVNNATVGDDRKDAAGFFVGGHGLIAGDLVNNGTIKGGGDEWGALTLGKDADVRGGIFNNGTIVSERGNAINLGYREDGHHWSTPQGVALTGDIVNAGSIEGHDHGIAALYGTMTGALINEATGTIEGGDIAVYIADSFTSWTGGIENRGLIAGDEAGLQIGSLYGGYGDGVVFAGGIVNAAGARITAKSGPSVAIGGTNFSGGFYNAGLITQQAATESGCNWIYQGVGVVFEALQVDGGLTNDEGGVIEGLTGPAIWVTSRTEVFAGGIVNKGTLDGASDGVLIEAESFLGGVVNTATGRILGGSGAALNIAGWSFEGGVENAGLIEGRTGIVVEAEALAGGIANASGATIKGNGGVAIWITDNTAEFAKGISNEGAIEGSHGGILIESETFDGGLFNAALASIVALDGDAVFADATWFGDFENRGLVSGAARGFAYAGPAFDGNVINAGDIEGGDVAFFMGAPVFDGAFTNSGDIAGGTTGVALVLGQATGAFTNSGAISGDTGTGVFIDVDQWGSADAPADIVNAWDGTITGGQTGFWLSVLNVFGDFINNGEISGGGQNTGIHIDALTYVGDILNNGVAEAPSNAVYLKIGELTGRVANTGTIAASAPNGVAVALDIGNGATFANEDGGLIVGDVVLGGSATYTFVGHDGGLEGDLIGNGGGAAALAYVTNDDLLVVEDGTQYFVDGQLANLLRFDVDDGGVAVMGGRSVGDPEGPGYGSTNVDALNVNTRGRLYLDDDTILNVGSFTQSAGGELTFYLVAPTGDPVAGSDYGRIDASGPVTLDGKLSVVLDAASFGGTSETEFNYVDIIRGASFSGEFDDLAIQGSTYFFELALTYGDTSLDLEVTRTPFDVLFCAEHLSQNSTDLGAALEAAFLAGGFTPEQIELFDFLGQLEDVCGAYFDLGGAVLGDMHAIAIETAGPWKSAVNDRLNSTGATSCVVAGAGGCLTRYAQNEIGGSQVATDASDPFAWLRTGVRPEGQLSFWGRLLGVKGDNEGRGGATGSDFTVTGGIAGADYVFSQRFIAGLAAQWTTADVDFKHRRDTADVQSFEIGGYFSYGDADFCVNGNSSIIFHDFDTYRFPFGETAQGAYNGRTISAYAEAGKVFEFDLLRVEPVLGLSYAALNTDRYAETGTAGGNLLIVEGADHKSLKSMIGARFAYPLDLLASGRKIVPEARVMWGHEYLDDRAQFTAALSSLPNNRFTVHGQEFARDSLLAGAGLNLPLWSQATLYADYDLALSRNQAIQSVSVGARVSW